MEFYPSKCEVLYVRRFNLKGKYKMNGKTLNSIDATTDDRNAARLTPQASLVTAEKPGGKACLGRRSLINGSGALGGSLSLHGNGGRSGSRSLGGGRNLGSSRSLGGGGMWGRQWGPDVGDEKTMRTQCGGTAMRDGGTKGVSEWGRVGGALV